VASSPVDDPWEELGDLAEPVEHPSTRTTRARNKVDYRVDVAHVAKPYHADWHPERKPRRHPELPVGFQNLLGSKGGGPGPSTEAARAAVQQAALTRDAGVYRHDYGVPMEKQRSALFSRVKELERVAAHQVAQNEFLKRRLEEAYEREENAVALAARFAGDSRTFINPTSERGRMLVESIVRRRAKSLHLLHTEKSFMGLDDLDINWSWPKTRMSLGAHDSDGEEWIGHPGDEEKAKEKEKEKDNAAAATQEGPEAFFGPISTNKGKGKAPNPVPVPASESSTAKNKDKIPVKPLDVLLDEVANAPIASSSSRVAKTVAETLRDWDKEADEEAAAAEAAQNAAGSSSQGVQQNQNQDNVQEENMDVDV